jgi:hypothetical protein
MGVREPVAISVDGFDLRMVWVGVACRLTGCCGRWPSCLLEAVEVAQVVGEGGEGEFGVAGV